MSVWLSRRLVTMLLRRIKVGSLVVVESDERRVDGSGSPAAIARIDSPRTWPMLLGGSRGMADAFAQGLWDSPDLVALIRLAACNAGGLDRLRSLLVPARWPLQRARAVLRRSTKRQRRRDIAAHYDLGNELFSRMLDPTMSYSCAVFEHEGMTLEQAQLAKLERVCEQLDLRPGDRVLEIGTGWGAFALHAAASRGWHVTTTTISREQHDYAVEQALSRDPERARAALGDQVEVHARTEPTKCRPPAGALAGADAVVHPLGEPIAQRHSEQAMARIRDSRVQGTRLQAAALREVTGDSRPAVLISVGDRLLRPNRQPDVLGDR